MLGWDCWSDEPAPFNRPHGRLLTNSEADGSPQSRAGRCWWCGLPLSMVNPVEARHGNDAHEPLVDRLQAPIDFGDGYGVVKVLDHFESMATGQTP